MTIVILGLVIIFITGLFIGFVCGQVYEQRWWKKEYGKLLENFINSIERY